MSFYTSVASFVPGDAGSSSGSMGRPGHFNQQKRIWKNLTAATQCAVIRCDWVRDAFAVPDERNGLARPTRTKRTSCTQDAGLVQAPSVARQG